MKTGSGGPGPGCQSTGQGGQGTGGRGGTGQRWVLIQVVKVGTNPGGQGGY
jgi:hypothetical protein